LIEEERDSFILQSMHDKHIWVAKKKQNLRNYPTVTDQRHYQQKISQPTASF